MHQPLISICIPTYQRCDTLKNTVESILSSDLFQNSNQIELAISNNASSDFTHEYCLSLIDRYPEKVKYQANDENIRDNNFESVLRLATGKLRKLHNDSFLITPEFFEEVLPVIKQIENIRPTIFFLNGNYSDATEPVTTCTTANEFLRHISFYITWGGAYSIWENQLAERPDFGKMAARRFIQVDNILRQIKSKDKFLIFNKPYFIGQSFGKKVDYNIAEVFGDNLLSLFDENIKSGEISENVMLEFKHNLLFKHIIKTHFDEKLGSDRSGFNKYLSAYFHDLQYLDFIQRMYGLADKNFIEKKLSLNHILWRKLNEHNETYPTNYFDIDAVTVGRRTYGALKVGSWGHAKEKLEIGALCSIGDNVHFMLGGNHDLQYLTTYPFKVKLGQSSNEASSKGPIIVEDDVWIGNNCTILSGLRIGRGAVIGSGAVVAKDIPPYAVVIGNPAKVVKYRFNEDIINKLMKVDLKKLASRTDLEDHLEILYSVLENNNVDFILNYFKRLDCIL